MCRIAQPPHLVVITQTDPAEFISAFGTCEHVNKHIFRRGIPLILTCHVVASIIFIDAVDTIAARALLRELANSSKTRGFLRLLVTLFAAGCTILVLLTCFAPMPCVLVEDTHLVAT